MAKHQKPSGDPIPNEPGAHGVTDTAQPIAHADALTADVPVESNPPVEAAPAVLPDGHVWIELLDANGNVFDRQSIPAHEAIFQVNLSGQWWRHVSTAPDGVWRYMV